MMLPGHIPFGVPLIVTALRFTLTSAATFALCSSLKWPDTWWVAMLVAILSDSAALSLEMRGNRPWFSVPDTSIQRKAWSRAWLLLIPCVVFLTDAIALGAAVHGDGSIIDIGSTAALFIALGASSAISISGATGWLRSPREHDLRSMIDETAGFELAFVDILPWSLRRQVLAVVFLTIGAVVAAIFLAALGMVGSEMSILKGVALWLGFIGVSAAGFAFIVVLEKDTRLKSSSAAS